MILEILKYPHPTLHKKAKAVKRVDSRIKKLIKSMIETMQAAPGIGLAAPQVGESVRVIVADLGEGPFVVVNPKIKNKSGPTQIFEEGCLCLPGLVGPVERPSFVTVSGLDRNGQPITIDAEEFLATVLQHEIDHLEGKVFIDRIKNKSLIREISRKEEIENKEFI